MSEDNRMNKGKVDLVNEFGTSSDSPTRSEALVCEGNSTPHPDRLSLYGAPRFTTSDARVRLRNSLANISGLQGHFAIAVSRNGEEILFCSADGVTQLFYAVHEGRFFFDTSVAGVVAASGLTWQWDYQALADLAIFGHVLTDETLHPAVRRVGAGELITWNGSSISRRRISRAPDPAGDEEADPAKILLDIVESDAGPGDSISMSAGFDSRVILAAFLALGLKPSLLVMGDDRSTDVRIATLIARKTGLSLERVPLDGRDMLADRSLIARLTSGTKTVDNWHTYEYARRAALQDGTPLWIGSNGEYARTFFFDRGLLFPVAEASGSLAVRHFWKAKVQRTAIPDGFRAEISDELRECLNPAMQVDRLMSLFPERKLGELVDSFYLERVRQFIANGLKLVSTRYTTRTPFLNPRWMAAIMRLNRVQKLGNRWHRRAIEKLYPKLLELPYCESGKAMGRNPGTRYWFGLEPHSRNIPYLDYNGVFKGAAFQEAFRSALPSAKGIFRGDDPDRILIGEQSTRTTAYVATLSFFSEMVSGFQDTTK